MSSSPGSRASSPRPAAASDAPLNFSGLFPGSANPSPKPHLQMDKCDEFEFEVPEEAPVFVPTAEEFKNPLLYISKIRPVAEKFGICKIKPPSDWQPPFTVDVDRLKFTPRVQRLNELEAKTRIKLNFLDQIAKFWELQGNSLKIPMVERKALDLYSLHRIVQEEGGIELTTKERRWSKIANRMGYPVGKNVGTILKGHYERILYPFDIYTSGKHVDGTNLEAGEESDDCDYKPHCIVSRQAVQPPVETTARRSKRVAQNVDQSYSESEMNLSKDKNSELRRLQIFGAPSPPTVASPSPKKSPDKVPPSPVKIRGDKRESRHLAVRLTPPPQDPLAKYICHICNRGDVEEAMLLCDGCDDSYHTFCLMPPLADIPRGDWRCPKCVVEEVTKPIEAFGFEQAQREYTLQQFGEMADQFKSDYFNMPVHLVPTDLVEREFWRITSSIDEDVTVEYGADLHTMDHGSGFPTKNALLQMPADQRYADSAWNLNNLPLLEESILGYINADISGMKIPWMYVGMCFATFCWHNEDHWSYSINYLHWGEPKTWYGVPGTAAERFEATMKRAAPELFHSQPDLLHQLVTIMNPNILMAAGVPVYRTDQRAGEFVITFPRAYHAGFNQGYNFAEAVNFAPADWMRMGRDCVNHYSKLRRVCVFSHDELVCKMALESERLNLGIATACYLDMVEMIDTEKKLRKSLLEWGVTKAEREAFELMQDDERQCDYCKTTCFLSAVTCECAKNLVCLRHYSELCKCPAEKHTLKYRYTLDELPLMLKKLKHKAESFEMWLGKVRMVLDPTATSKVSFDEVQELALEADQKKFPTSTVLERLQSAVLEAEKCITVIQQLDINKVRTRTRHSHDTAKYKLTLEELDLFVQEIDHLCCIIADGISVKELQQMGYEFTAKVQQLMDEQTIATNDSEELAAAIQEGNALCIELPQLEYMRARLEQVLWYQSVVAMREKAERPTHAILKKVLADGLKVTPAPFVEEQMVALQDLVVKASTWEEQVKIVLEQRAAIKLPEMQDLLQSGATIHCHLPSYSQLKDSLRRAQECLDSLEGLQTNENYPYLDTLEFIIQRALLLPFRLEPVQAMEEHVAEANGWRERACHTFLKRHSKYTLLEALTPKYDSDLTFAATPLQSPPSQSSGGSDTEVPADSAHSSASSTSSSSTISASSSNTSNDSYLEDLGPAIVVATFKKAEQNEVQRLQEIRGKNSAKHPERDLYCLCKGHFMGPMHHCQLCRDWFHVTCVPPMKALKKGGEGEEKMPDLREKYLCPLCQRTKRPKLETILSLLVALQKIPLRVPEGEALQCVTERAMQWQDRVRQALARKDVAVALAKLSIQQMKKEKSRKAKKLARVTDDVKQNDSTTLTPSSSETGSDAENLSDLGDEQEIDEELFKTTPEHAYSLMCDKLIFSAASGPQATPIIHLNKATQEFLDELMMEGDLLEVSLDETVYLWKILNAAKHRVNELEVIKAKYNIPNESPARVYNEENYKKRKSHEAYGQPPKKHLKTIKAEPQEEEKAPLDFAPAFPSPVKEEVKSEPDSESTVTDEELSGAGDNDEYTGRKAKPRKLAIKSKMRVIKNKKKKFKVVLKDKNEPEVVAIGVEATPPKQKRKKTVAAASVTSPAVSLPGSPMKKANRTHRKGKGSETVASDEDEMCSMSNCAKPSGSEVDWVQCDGGCNKWFHMFCVGMDKTQIRPDVDFICTCCKPPVDAADAPAEDVDAPAIGKRTKVKGASSCKENKV